MNNKEFKALGLEISLRNLKKIYKIIEEYKGDSRGRRKLKKVAEIMKQRIIQKARARKGHMEKGEWIYQNGKPFEPISAPKPFKPKVVRRSASKENTCS